MRHETTANYSITDLNTSQRTRRRWRPAIALSIAAGLVAAGVPALAATAAAAPAALASGDDQGIQGVIRTVRDSV
jgi:hypothetical protein